MTAQKRRLEDTAATPKSKKTRLAQDGAKDKKSKKRDAGGAEQTSVPLPLEELDFPRGGGTSFTPVEVKAIRAEAVKEANEELFKVCRIIRYPHWY